MGSSNYDAFIFNHIPKCAGTSFREYLNRSALASNIAKNLIYIPGENGLKITKNIGQLSPSELKRFRTKNFKVLGLHSKFDFHKKHHPNLINPFYFTILREPIERYISHYNFFNKHLGYNNCRNKSLDDLHIDDFKTITSMHGNLQTKYLLGLENNAIISGQEYLVQAKTNLKTGYHSFGMLHDMKRSLLLLEKVGPEWLNWSADLRMLNSHGHSTGDTISKERLDLMKQNNRLDLQVFDYALELWQKM